MLLQIAAGYGVTYEPDVDLSNANYSAARGTPRVFEECRLLAKQIMVAQMLGPCWKWFVNAAEIMGEQPMDVRMA